MSDPQTQPFILRYSMVAGFKPPASEFDLNTFVVNRADGILYWRDPSGLVNGAPILPGLTPGELVLPSAATADLGSVVSPLVYISGTTTISSFGTAKALMKYVRFGDVLTLNHDPVNLVLPGAANITTAAGDTCMAVSDGTGRWRVRGYVRADGTPLGGFLRYDMAQALTTGQAAQVRTNLGLDTIYTRKRNRFVDPGCRISQENGSNSVAIVTGAAYGSDSLGAYRNGGSAAGTIQRIASLTPGGSPYRVRATSTAANTAPGQNEIIDIFTKIEGEDISDLRFGTSAAKSIVIRFGVRSSLAGTFPFGIANDAGTRVWSGSYQISAAEVGTDVVRSFVIPGDQLGTWRVDNGVGIVAVWPLWFGSGLIGTPGWQSTNTIVSPGCTNLFANNGATIDIFDIGFYDGSVVPNFELPAFEDDLAKAMRYFEIGILSILGNGYAAGALVSSNLQTYKERKRVIPTLVFYNFYYNATASSTCDVNDVDGFRVYCGASGASPNVQVQASFSSNARM